VIDQLLISKLSEIYTYTFFLSLRRRVGIFTDDFRGLLWPMFGYRNPVPVRAKRKVLQRYGANCDVWIETGTYLGRTTEWLAGFEKSVITIEAQPFLARFVANRLRSKTNVRVIQGLSEVIFADLLPQLSGSVSFWLDGHFSAGITGLGLSNTPIRRELSLIEDYRGRLEEVTVLVDDFRCFGSSLNDHSGYPPKTELVDWAVRNKLSWTVEHDVFIATSKAIQKTDSSEF